MNIEIYREEALEFIESTMREIPLKFVVIDDWRCIPESGPRLIYDTWHVDNCTEACASCPLFNAVGSDPKELLHGCIVPTLIPASLDDLELFPGKQRCLNCKTLEQYAGCFVAWLIEKCKTRKDIEDELELVRYFRIIYPADHNNEELEETMRVWVVNQAVAQSDSQKSNTIKEVAAELGII